MVKVFMANINYDGEIQFGKGNLIASFRNKEWALIFIKSCPMQYAWVLLEGKSNSNLERDNTDTKFLQSYIGDKPFAYYWNNGIMKAIDSRVTREYNNYRR